MNYKEFLNRLFNGGAFYQTSPFGNRVVNGVAGFHRGIDYGTNGKKLPLYAPFPLYVTATGSAKDGDSLGNRVYLNDGTYIYQLAHLDSYVVKPAQSLAKGDLIGYVGTTGRSTGVHLHLGVFPNADWSKAYTSRGWFNPELATFGHIAEYTPPVAPIIVPTINETHKECDNTINDLTNEIYTLKQEISTHKAMCNKYTDEIEHLRSVVSEKDALILSYKKEINDRVKIFIAPRADKFVISLKDKDELFIKRTY